MYLEQLTYASPEANSLGHPNFAIKQPHKAPGVELIHFPSHPNMFDGFVVSGRAWGSDLQKVRVGVTVANTTRYGQIRDGLWAVVFEDGALPQYCDGNQEIIARVTDGLGFSAEASLSIYLEKFVDSFVSIDSKYVLDDDGSERHLIVTGELNLGTHLIGRDLTVALISDDDGARKLAIGEVANGWHHGEWQARIPVSDCSGYFRVQAQLLDESNSALNRLMVSQPIFV